jgi:hypothetical protein
MNMRKVWMTGLVALTLAGCADSNDEPGGETGNTTTVKGRLAVTVLDYSPAPGQFVNDIPAYADGDTKEKIIAKAQSLLDNGSVLSLGGFGGSVTLKLKTPIYAAAGNEFRVLGNAFLSTDETATKVYGSSEPGIVMVMTDTNNNGVADDTWYELRGEASTGSIITVTYRDNSSAGDDANFVTWTASDGTSGAYGRNVQYHNHSFFPLWLSQNGTMTVTGRRIADNGEYDATTEQYRQQCFRGYADSYPNTSERSALSLSSAIDPATGAAVTVQRVDFVKIYTAVLQYNGPLGECSTEVSGIEAL